MIIRHHKQWWMWFRLNSVGHKMRMVLRRTLIKYQDANQWFLYWLDFTKQINKHPFVFRKTPRSTSERNKRTRRASHTVHVWDHKHKCRGHQDLRPAWTITPFYSHKLQTEVNTKENCVFIYIYMFVQMIRHHKQWWMWVRLSSSQWVIKCEWYLSGH